MDRVDVRFLSGGTSCAAWHYRAAGDAPRGCVVLAHGFTMTRDARLAQYVERFAAAGLDALVFDYRCFGDSAGTPRQWLDVPRQLEDWRAAIALARTLPDVDPDRIALWGTSFSGGHVAALAATDRRIAAVVSQAPFSGLGGRDKRAPRRTRHQLALLRAAFADRAAGARPRYIPVAGEPGEFAAFNLPHAVEQLGVLVGPGSTWENRFTPRVILQMLRYRPFARAGEITCPWLLVVCDPDTITPASAARRRAALAPRLTVERHDYQHFEIYFGKAFERLVATQTEFLRAALGGAAPRAPA